jgi:hypothetical protein
MPPLFLPPAARGPHGMGDQLGPSGLLKASLNESNRQQMYQNLKCYIIHWNLYTKRVSKPSIFLTSDLLNFFLFPGPVQHLQKLFINILLTFYLIPSKKLFFYLLSPTITNGAQKKG